jgi:NAD(P)-dependent dehydrogenase (short-subunit alcohol dehydrogenase family)
MRRFAGKTAFITGGASGIGRALASELIAAGAKVAIADIANAAEAAQSLGCEGVVLDVTNAADVARTLRTFTGKHGRLDYVFNNAGVAIVGDTGSMSDEDWTRVLDVNVNGVVYGVRAAYPIMIQQGFGHIVNTASAAGLLPIPGAVVYATSKHAVVGLSISLRAEARRHGVKVSVLCPSFVRTAIADHVKLLGGLDRARAMSIVELIGWMKPEAFARRALLGLARNEAVIVAPGSARLLVSAARRFPVVADVFAGIAAHVVARLG